MSSQAAMRTAIEEIRRGEELMNVLQSHLQLHTKATDLSQGVIQSLSAALSILKSREITNGMASGAQKEAISGKKRGPLAASAETNQSERDQKKRKDMNPNSWTIVTPAPYLDGHQWRKYGQKINKQKSKYPRSYYRCTHSGDQGCPATKIVQEEECGTYSAMFKVVYSNKHTCNTSMSEGVEQTILVSPPTPSSFFIFESKKSYSSFQNLTKKEEIFSAGPINKDCNVEKFSLHNKSCSSLINNSTLSDLKMKAKGEDDVSSAPMIKGFPNSPTGLLDYYDFDFGDVASILSSLDQ